MHLELVGEFAAKAFLRRARREIPEEIISDNAPQFKLLQRAVKTSAAVKKSSGGSSLSITLVRRYLRIIR